MFLIYFDNQGYNVVGLNRSNKTNDDRVLMTDLTNTAELKEQINSLVERYGPPKVVIHNTAKLIIKPFEQTSLQDYEVAWQSMFLSAVNIAKSVLPSMVSQKTGNFIISGATASLRGSANFSAFSSAKFALRALAQSLAKEYT